MDAALCFVATLVVAVATRYAWALRCGSLRCCRCCDALRFCASLFRLSRLRRAPVVAIAPLLSLHTHRCYASLHTLLPQLLLHTHYMGVYQLLDALMQHPVCFAKQMVQR